MDPDKRIEDLEAQVRELSSMVHTMLEAHEDGGRRRAPQAREAGGHDRQIMQDLRRRVDRVLRGESDESLEAHLGGVWLSRTAVVLFVVFVALGARTLVLAEGIPGWQKVAAGYGVAVFLCAAGLLMWRHHDVFAKGFLGSGLAGLYLMTHLAVMPTPFRLLDGTAWGSYVLLALLVVSFALAWRLHGQTIAVVVSLSAYLTVWIAGPRGGVYLILCCLALAVLVLPLQFRRGWLLLTWVATLGTHFSFATVIRPLYVPHFNPMSGLTESPGPRAAVYAAVLGACYVLLLAGALSDARHRGSYHRSVAPLVLLSSLSGCWLAHGWLAANAPEYRWCFWLCLGGLWLVCAVFSERRGPERNLVSPLLLAQSVVAVTVALWQYLPPTWFLAGLGIESLILALAYKRSGVVFLKVLTLALITVAVVAGLLSARRTDVTDVAGYVLPESWVGALAMALVFAVAAAFHEHFVRQVRPEERTISGQWFMAGSLLNWRGASIAIYHAAAAAFVLVCVTIFQFGDDPRMPYLLAALSAGFALLGLVLLTPQLEVGCVLLLMAAHLCYHVYLWLDMAGFGAQPHHVELSIVLALFTYLGAYLWERYVRLYHPIGPDWEHHLLAAGPYLAGTALLATLAWWSLAPVHVPVALGGLTLVLLLIGSLVRYPGVKAAGVLAGFMGAVALALELETGSPSPHGAYPFYVALFLITCVGGERLVAKLEHHRGMPSHAEDYVRTLFVAIVAALGTEAMLAFSSGITAVLLMAGYGVVLTGLGFAFRVRRYQWAALGVVAFAVVWAVTRSSRFTPLYQTLAFGIAALVLLGAWWAYSHTRVKRPER